MATLTKSTGTVTLSGAVEKVTFPAVYGWVWVKNMSDADMFVGLSDGISAGADGVMRIPAGDAGRIQTDGQDSVYLMGTGNALVVAQNYADCPFKAGGKGGEIPDLSAYAKKTDVPNIKVNSAVDADTVGNIHISCTNDAIPNSNWLAAFTNENNLRAIDPQRAYVGNAGLLKPTLIGTAEYCTYHTILDWANSVNGMGQAVIVSGSGFPSDIPVGDEGMVIVETDNENMRKIVTFKSYGSGHGTYRRNIWSGEWRWDWVDLFSEKPYVTGVLSEQANDSPVTLSFEIFDFTPSKVICQFGSGNAFFANVVTNGFSLTIPAGTTTIQYIAFK